MISNEDKYNKYRPKKFLGQNFLVDENIAKKIVSSLEIHPGDIVIEIGPGQGVLTKYISEQTDNLIAVELDRSIYEKLSAEYSGRAKIIHKDFLKFDLENNLNEILDVNVYGKLKLKVIGNIPYNITTEILFRLFDSADIMDTAVLMMQKEVAKRLTAQPNTKEYGILAVQTQFSSDPKILFGVPPTAFFPKPNVESSIVKFGFSKNKYKVADKQIFRSLVRNSFGQRRKTMKNSLKRFFEMNDVSFDQIEFDFSRRAESLSIQEFTLLSDRITELKLSSRY
ncbi:MAG: ribosomal RNA small subunit methyltransferase A [Bacteroidetes bacterium]|nr:ribosomal RNA small subunit methyltransferase A [Bacteroidota bacterium]